MLFRSADLPLLRAAHLRPLIHAWQNRNPAIHAQVPVVDGARGHPVLLAWDAVEAIHHAAESTGVRDWLRAHPERVRMRPCEDEAHVFDIDTGEDVVRLSACIAPHAVSWP